MALITYNIALGFDYKTSPVTEKTFSVFFVAPLHDVRELTILWLSEDVAPT
jgi:hypothetical protein